MTKIKKKSKSQSPIKAIITGHNWAVYGDSNGIVKLKFYDLEIDIKL